MGSRSRFERATGWEKGGRTAPTAPLSLARVKMSISIDMFEALRSQETMAIHGVRAAHEVS